ncbi:endonuclease/exonuclease/phosphatase family protein [Marinicaulis aureus]|uniref:Endonuclease/exonuclease/phosphatase family protein n=1 Tax=Hyphococcus aureus TaxID=2666033 RepID=A0ABW1KW99_9PROT
MKVGKFFRAPFLALNALLFCAHAALSATSSYADAPPPQNIAKIPKLQIDPMRGTASAELSVMTYNVAGLPWPIKKGREAALKDIKHEIETLHASGRAPDIVVLQEAFTPAAARIGAAYPNRVRGPAASDRSVTGAPQISDAFIRARRFEKGERSGKLMPSGLYILSDYPVVDASMTPFRATSCAGYDCLANKGAMIASIQIPGAPAPVQILTTHLNSNHSSGVSEERSRAAHRQQVDELGDLVARGLNPRWPFIYAGDFNTRHSKDRFGHNAQTLPGVFVRQHCFDAAAGCDASNAVEGGAAPWLETQDLQGFVSGSDIEVRPVRAEKMFHEPVNGRVLSDHDAYLVTYRLTWKLEKLAAAD